ncbi:MAG: YggS family pyridoxal phosphate-dependent enzyme [Oscillospiraceae bacterium]|nr:YggS family pyridoxal phosphate-dependent enzyme [Oscillospiraceae bacterium]
MESRQVQENYRRISETIAEAADRSGRKPEEITFMAVTKTVAPELVNAAIACGIKVLGENRVQEYLSKKDSYEKNTPVDFIGTLQSNKVKYIIQDMRLIQSVNKFSLAKEIERCAAKLELHQDILLEINIGGEDSKSGLQPDGLPELLMQIAELEHVHVKGLMTIPPPCQDTSFLQAMQELFLKTKERIQDSGIPDTEMQILSMGMSDDYAQAILCGSTLVRVGSALFGARDYSKL